MPWRRSVVAGSPLDAGRKRRARGAASNAKQTAEVLPKLIPQQFIKPDLPGEGPIPDGYLTYPKELVVAIKKKPGSSGRTIKTMTAAWGPTPPGLGRNAYLAAVNAELGVSVDSSVQDGNTYADKLSAMLGARDVPDLSGVPSWEIDKIPRFSEAVKALFEDLTDYLKGDAVAAYPMLATLPTAAWRYAVWGGRLAAVPCPTDGPFPWALFYRKDLTDKAGVEAPKTIDELYQFGKKVTERRQGRVGVRQHLRHGADVLQVPGIRRAAGGGSPAAGSSTSTRRRSTGRRSSSRRALQGGPGPPRHRRQQGRRREAAVQRRQDAHDQDGLGAWQGMQAEQAKVTPGFNMQPVPIFSAVGGDPHAWGDREAHLLHVHQEGPRQGAGRGAAARAQLVRRARSAPRSIELRKYGMEGKHFTRGRRRQPGPTDLGRKEIADQYGFLGGRVPAVVGTADAELREGPARPTRERPSSTWSRTRGGHQAREPGELFEDHRHHRGQDHRHRARPPAARRPRAIVKEWRATRRRRGARVFREGARRQRSMTASDAQASARVTPRRKTLGARLRRDWPLLAMTAPAACLLLVFHYLPTLGNVIAFQDYNPFVGDNPFEAFLHSEWIGFGNFETLFADPAFWDAVVQHADDHRVPARLLLPAADRAGDPASQRAVAEAARLHPGRRLPAALLQLGAGRHVLRADARRRRAAGPGAAPAPASSRGTS